MRNKSQTRAPINEPQSEEQHTMGHAPQGHKNDEAEGTWPRVPLRARPTAGPPRCAQPPTEQQQRLRKRQQRRLDEARTSLRPDYANETIERAMKALPVLVEGPSAGASAISEPAAHIPRSRLKTKVNRLNLVRSQPKLVKHRAKPGSRPTAQWATRKAVMAHLPLR